MPFANVAGPESGDRTPIGASAAKHPHDGLPDELRIRYRMVGIAGSHRMIIHESNYHAAVAWP